MARSPDRIRPTLIAVEQLWRQYPDLRLGQLISNIAAVVDRDDFYIEDDHLQRLANRIRSFGWDAQEVAGESQ